MFDGAVVAADVHFWLMRGYRSVYLRLLAKDNTGWLM